MTRWITDITETPSTESRRIFHRLKNYANTYFLERKTCKNFYWRVLIKTIHDSFILTITPKKKRCPFVIWWILLPSFAENVSVIKDKALSETHGLYDWGKKEQWKITRKDTTDKLIRNVHLILLHYLCTHNMKYSQNFVVHPNLFRPGVRPTATKYIEIFYGFYFFLPWTHSRL